MFLLLQTVRRQGTSILIVSREKELAAKVEARLGTTVNVLVADNGFDALTQTGMHIPALIVLDCNLSRMNGAEAGRIIRQDERFRDIYLYFLLDESSGYKSITDLKELAEDCFLKPLNYDFLCYRIKEQLALNATVHHTSNPGRHNGELFIDRETYTIHYKGKNLNFPRKEFELIYLLASSPEKVFTRGDIFRNVWNKEINNRSARTIDVHIRKLREKLIGINIITVKGVGYKLSLK